MSATSTRMDMCTRTNRADRKQVVVARSSRKRSRQVMLLSISAAAAVLVQATPSVVAFSVPVTQRPATRGPSATTTTTLPAMSATSQKSLYTTTSDDQVAAPLHPSLYESEKHLMTDSELRYYNSEMETDDDEEDPMHSEHIMSQYRKLQESTGSEVLPTDLQRQIDLAVDTETPNAFLDSIGGEGASDLEKVAMGSITEQLPHRAVQAITSTTSSSTTPPSASSSSSSTSTTTLLNSEQEIQLARIIQGGAKLQAVRDSRAAELGLPPHEYKSLPSQEWADAAGLSTKELRRAISSYRQAKHKLVTANMGLVHAVVHQQIGFSKHNGLTKAELVQEGSLGLLRAAELFDPERGLRFSTYAVVWIKGTLSNSHAPELVRLPAREKTRWNKIVRAKYDIEEIMKDSGQQQPSVEQIAAQANLSVDQVLATQRNMQQVHKMLSLDAKVRTLSRSGGDVSTMDAFSRDKSLQSDDPDIAVRTQLKLDVIQALARNLDAREARLVRLRYGLNDGQSRSLAVCADCMGLSPTRVQQIAKKALEKLRQAAEAESLEEYLLTIA